MALYAEQRWLLGEPQTKVIIKIIKVSRGGRLDVGMDDGSRNIPATGFGERRLITFDDYALICT